MKYNLSSIVSIVIFVWVFYIINPSSDIKKSSKGTISSLFDLYFPQGFGFFTKKPDENKFYFYLENEKGEVSNIDLSNTAFSENLFGLNRIRRYKNYELSQLIIKSQDTNWIEYNGQISKIDFKNLKFKPILYSYNSNFEYIKKGQIFYICLIKNIPYKWSYLQNPNFQRCVIAKVIVQ